MARDREVRERPGLLLLRVADPVQRRPDEISQLVGRASGCDFHMPFADAQRQTLILGKSNAGKTNFATGAVLALQRTNAPIVVNDAGGSLVNNLAATNARFLFDLEKAAAKNPALREAFERERERTKYLFLHPTNPTGIAFDLLKLRTVPDIISGEPREEMVAERVAEIMGVLSHQRGKEAEIYNIIARTAPAALAALIAAGGYSVRDLPRLLDPLEVSFREQVAAKINRSPHLHEPIVKDAYRVFVDIGRSAHRWDENVDSTVRMFGFLRTSGAFFDRDAFDFQAFHDRGGRLYVNFVHADPRDEALMRRLILSLWYSATACRSSATDVPPSFCFLDETKGLDPETLASHMVRSRNKRAFLWITAQSAAQFGEHFPSILGAAERLVLFSPSSEDDARRFVSTLSRATLTRILLPTRSHVFGTTETEGGSETWQTVQSQQQTEGAHERPPDRPQNSFRALETTAPDAYGLDRTERKLVRTTDLEPSSGGGDWLASRSSSNGLSHAKSSSNQWSRGVQQSATFGTERISVAEQMQVELNHFVQLPPHYAYFCAPGRGATLVHLFPNRTDWERPARRKLAQMEFLRQRAIHYRAPLTEAYTFAFPVIGAKTDKPAPRPPRPDPVPPRTPPRRPGNARIPRWAGNGKGRAER